MRLFFGALVTFFSLWTNASDHAKASALDLTPTDRADKNLSTPLGFQDPQDLRVADKTYRSERNEEARTDLAWFSSLFSNVRDPERNFHSLKLKELIGTPKGEQKFGKWMKDVFKYRKRKGDDVFFSDYEVFDLLVTYAPVETVLELLEKHGMHTFALGLRKELEQPNSAAMENLHKVWLKAGLTPARVFDLLDVKMDGWLKAVTESSDLRVNPGVLRWLKYARMFIERPNIKDAIDGSEKKIESILLHKGIGKSEHKGIGDLQPEHRSEDILSHDFMYAISIRVMMDDPDLKILADRLEFRLHQRLISEEEVSPLDFYNHLSHEEGSVLKLNVKSPRVDALEAYTLAYARAKQSLSEDEVASAFAHNNLDAFMKVTHPEIEQR